MTGRPPLPVGSYGRVQVTELGPRRWEARCRFRDADGRTRRVKRTGPSRTAAENELKRALGARRASAGAELSGASRVREAAALWLAQREAEVAAGAMAPRSLETYRSAYTLHVAPALGELRLREVTTARCEQWLMALRRQVGASMCKTAKSVLSGVLGYAARLDAVVANPVRDTSRVPESKRKRRPRSMTRAERDGWLAAVDSSELACQWHLGDLTRFMLATGVRVGEALAVSWDEVDLGARTVQVAWHMVRVTGEGLLRMEGAKSVAGQRLLMVPRWCADMLARRLAAPGGGYPVFPDSVGGWRDPTAVIKAIREVRGPAGYPWVTSRVWRQTVITELDAAGLLPREVADQAGHSNISQTLDYMARKIASERAAEALEGLL